MQLREILLQVSHAVTFLSMSAFLCIFHAQLAKSLWSWYRWKDPFLLQNLSRHNANSELEQPPMFLASSHGRHRRQWIKVCPPVRLNFRRSLVSVARAPIPNSDWKSSLPRLRLASTFVSLSNSSSYRPEVWKDQATRKEHYSILSLTRIRPTEFRILEPKFSSIRTGFKTVMYQSIPKPPIHPPPGNPRAFDSR